MGGENCQNNAAVGLSAYLTALIAQADHVPAGEVTVNYIHQQREERIYPKTRYDVGTDYGGYCSEGLVFLTREEFEKLDREIDAELAKATTPS